MSFSIMMKIEKNSFYNSLLLWAYKRSIRRRAKVDPPGTWDLKALKKIKTKRELFETYYQTPTWSNAEKVATLEEYNEKIDIVPHLSKIKVPTLIIHAYDDLVSPIQPFVNLKNPNIITLLTKHGGHGGFFTTKKLYGDLDGHWAQNRAMEFIRLLENKS